MTIAVIPVPGLPMIRPGDRVLLGPEPSIRPGLVVLADFGGKPILHRVARCTDGEVILRGDATLRNDPPIRAADVVGSVRMVSRGAVIQGQRLTAPVTRTGGS